MTVYCTYFDRHYLTRGLTLYASLVRHVPGVDLRVLCLDDETHRVLTRLALPGLDPVPLSALERADPVLRATRSDRTTLEYYFTCTPAWTRFVLGGVGPDDRVVYVDADLRFFSDPAPVFDEIGEASVAITPHRFPIEDHDPGVFGVYNVGFLVFRHDAMGHSVLADWRTRCIEWCYDSLEDERFADQKYLDAWPGRFPGVHVIRHPGAGLAPWNWRGHTIGFDDDPLTVDGRPLVFYHFHGFRMLGPWLYDAGVAAGAMPPALRGRLYRSYAAALRQARYASDRALRGVAREIPHRRDGIYNYYTGLLRSALVGRSTVHLVRRG